MNTPSTALPHFIDEGPKDAPALILIHGWATHSGYFEDLAATLKQQFRTIRMDAPGHGGSTHQFGMQPTMQDGADALKNLIAHLGLEKVALLGWSMGGAIAMNYLDSYGQRHISGLIIEDMSVRIVNDESWHLGIKSGFTIEKNQRVLPIMIKQWADYAKGFLPNVFAEGVPPPVKLLHWMEDEVKHFNPQTMASTWDSVCRIDYRHLPASLWIPVLVLWGGKSRIYRKETFDYWAAKTPNVKLIKMKDSGHAPHFEQPEEFAAAVIDFMKALPA